MHREKSWILLFSLLVLSCPKSSSGVRSGHGEGELPQAVVPDAQADAALAQAEQQAKSGVEAEQQIEAYLGVRAQHPNTTAALEALYRAGVLYYEAGDYASARRAFNELLFQNPLFDKAEDAKLKLGLSALEVQAFRDAYQTLNSLAEKSQGTVRRDAYDAAGRAAESAQLYGEALRIAMLLTDEATTEDERAAGSKRVADLVEGKVGFLDIAKVRESLPSTHPAWPVLTFKLARIYYHLRDWTRLEETLERFLREAPKHEFAYQAKELLVRAQRRSEVKPKVIGVVLPMSGRYKQLGDAVLRGIQLALRGSDLELVVKDSQGDVNLAGQQVEELAFDDQAIAIIGPLLNDDSRRAALVAEELQIPIITLTKSEGITAIGPHVFRNMLTNSQQAKALAEYAVGTLGFKTFAMLYPNIPFGVEMANSFWDEVLQRGATVRGAESYDHDQTTYAREVKKLVGRYYLDDRSDYQDTYREIMGGEGDAFRKRKAIEKARSKLEPVVDFDALLIPDSWQRVGLVTPALAFEDIITNACDERDLEKIKKTTGRKQIKTVTLLGTNTWNSPKNPQGIPELMQRGGKFVTCSIYVDGFFADSARKSTKRFVGAFGDAHKELQPTLLDAIGYDSAGMLRQVIEKARPRTRHEMTQQLSVLKGFEGATGTTHINDLREAEKPLFFLTIDSKGIRELTPKEKKGSGS
jgi:branched-chain amino acid transport system substrate-binding protein